MSDIRYGGYGQSLAIVQVLILPPEDPRLSLYFVILVIKHARHACVT